MSSVYNKGKENKYMKKNSTLIVKILDRSGSMSTIQNDMIGGFNTFIAQQKKIPGECKVSLYQFDYNYSFSNVVEVIYENRPLQSVPELTTETFVPRGSTPLYDAVAFVIKSVGEQLAALSEEDRPEKVLVVIITDGEENASREWKPEQVKQMIEHQQNTYKWEFVYLGANQNAWTSGGHLGVKASSTLGYVASSGGTDAMWGSLSDKVGKYRSTLGAESVNFDDADKDAQAKQGYKV
jgi:uncharacterized protein YegL